MQQTQDYYPQEFGSFWVIAKGYVSSASIVFYINRYKAKHQMLGLTRNLIVNALCSSFNNW